MHLLLYKPSRLRPLLYAVKIASPSPGKAGSARDHANKKGDKKEKKENKKAHKLAKKDNQAKPGVETPVLIKQQEHGWQL